MADSRPRFLRTSAHFVLTALGIFAAFLWRDMLNAGLEGVKTLILRVLPEFRHAGIVEGAVRVSLVVGVTVAIALVYDHLSTYDTTKEPNDEGT